MDGAVFVSRADAWKDRVRQYHTASERAHCCARAPGPVECSVCMTGSALRADFMRNGGFACSICSAVCCSDCLHGIMQRSSRMVNMCPWMRVQCFVCTAPSASVFKCLECGDAVAGHDPNTVPVKRMLDETDACVRYIGSAASAATARAAIVDAMHLIALQLHMRTRLTRGKDPAHAQSSMEGCQRTLLNAYAAPDMAERSAACAALRNFRQYISWTYVVGCLCMRCANETVLFAYCNGDCTYMLHRTALIDGTCQHCTSTRDAVLTRNTHVLETNMCLSPRAQ
jgi:hypothetical protein